MRQVFLSLFLYASLVLAPLTPAAAQTPLVRQDPGLWELRLVDGSSLASIALGVQQALKGLPEAQRRQMEQLMGARGIQLPTVIRQCLTSDMVHRDLKTELASHDIQCAELDWQASPDGGRFSFACTHPDGDWTGQGRMHNATARSFQSQASVQGKYKGQPVSLDMTHEARWLGADCGDVRPPAVQSR